MGIREDVDGIDLVFLIDNLRAGSATVTAKTDDHSVNSIWVSLNDVETKASLRRTKLEADGSFKFNYVPEGQYPLVTMRACDTDKNAPADPIVQMANPQFVKSYKDLIMPIDVKNDMTGLTLQVVEQPAAGAPAKP